MRTIAPLLVFCVLSPALATRAQVKPEVVVFWEDAFPFADTAATRREELAAALPAASFASAAQLDAELKREQTRLLVFPFGSAFPEELWFAVSAFLDRGGDLVVLGGRALTRPAYREGKAWKLRPARMSYAKQLFINDYQPTPGSAGLEFRPNEDFIFLNLPAFDWARAFSLTIRLSDEDLYARSGSAGGIDARLDALAWGLRDARRQSAPLVQIDHFKNHFVGGRWVLLACELPAGFFAGAPGKTLLSTLAAHALAGAEEFVVRPTWALFLPEEPLSFTVRWSRLAAQPAPFRLVLSVSSEGAPAEEHSFDFSPGAFPYQAAIHLPPRRGRGLHEVTARLYTGGALRAIYRTGFWLRDTAFLRSGPQLTVDHNFFRVDGRPVLVLGTTYMASDVQRQFFMSPNPYRWDRDMAEMRRAGVNMLRTGWWSAWDQVMKEAGVVHEEALRALEAYLMTARKYDLPVQFTFFAFIPEVLGGANAYVDPEAVRRQKELVLAVVERFKDAPFVIWDLINEPSFANASRLWLTRPNRDPQELKAWNRWLDARYPDPAARAAFWNAVPPADGSPVPLPDDEEFSPQAVYRNARGGNALKAYDYFLFAQEKFRDWVAELRDAIRAVGSRQLITVGQDESGGRSGLSPAFFGSAVDFTTNHTWWMHDDLLWDSLVAKQPGKPMLVQETGVSPEWQIDESQRRSATDEAKLLERKLAVALGTSAGAIHWLWNANAYMRDDREVSIGAVRADGTDKPEAEVLQKFAAFARQASSGLAQPEPPPVAIVTSQAFQYSALNWLALEAQTKAVRALEYHCRVSSYVIAENQLAQLGAPRLVILPSPQSLSEQAWQALAQYVRRGGNLLITGSFDRDPHWQVTGRLTALGLAAVPQPLTYRWAELRLASERIALEFDGEKQRFLEALRLPDGEVFRELALGQGRIFLAAYPVELAAGIESTAQLYRWALRKAGIEAPFTGQLPSSGVLIRQTILPESVLYLFVSESAEDEDIEVRDRVSGAELRLRLQAQRAQLVLLRRQDGRVIAQSDF